MRKHVFSTDGLPPRSRRDAVEEFLGSMRERVRLPQSPQDFEASMMVGKFAGLCFFVARSTLKSLECHGQGSMSDHISIAFNDCQNPRLFRYRSSETVIEQGDASMRLMELPAEHLNSTGTTTILFPAKEILQRLKLNDFAIAPCIRKNTPAVRLLRHYLDVARQDDLLTTAAEQQLFASHVYDLVALALGATADVGERARRGGLRAARLKAATDYIDSHFSEPGLSDQSVAAHLGVSDRYVRMLFADEDTSCKAYIDAQRLARAHAMLSNPIQAGMKIIDLAYRCGFNEVSTFNRAFRTRYGVTPSDVREQARRRAIV
jgi:AraC-like DNA-binding protein